MWNDPYILPKLTYGEYFTGPNRTGDKLYEAQIKRQTVYINNLLNGCTNESSFKKIRQLPKLTIITDITLSTVNSEGFWWNFYTEPQGKGTK
jgi:hypothetical protein